MAAGDSSRLLPAFLTQFLPQQRQLPGPLRLLIRQTLRDLRIHPSELDTYFFGRLPEQSRNRARC